MAMKYPNSPPRMNNPEVQVTNGTAHFFSRSYNPGAMKAHTCQRIHGAPKNREATKGVHTHMIENASITSIITNLASGIPVLRRASQPGAMRIAKSWLLKITQSKKMTPKPHNALMMRARSSSRCSRKDMRSMPPSSSSSSSSGGGGGGGVRTPPPAGASTGGGNISAGDGARGSSGNARGWSGGSPPPFTSSIFDRYFYLNATT